MNLQFIILRTELRSRSRLSTIGIYFDFFTFMLQYYPDDD